MTLVFGIARCLGQVLLVKGPEDMDVEAWAASRQEAFKRLGIVGIRYERIACTHGSQQLSLL